MRILAGHLPPTKGGLLLDGEPIVFSSPVQAEERGIVLVHQEILLADDLTAAQNLFLGREVKRAGLVDDQAMGTCTAAALAELGSRIPPDTAVRRLSIADRQLADRPRAPGAASRRRLRRAHGRADPVEAESLFAVIRRLKAQGTAVLYISHRLTRSRRSPTGSRCSATAASSRRATSRVLNRSRWPADGRAREEQLYPAAGHGLGPGGALGRARLRSRLRRGGLLRAATRRDSASAASSAPGGPSFRRSGGSAVL